jgi:hypothetical protein
LWRVPFGKRNGRAKVPHYSGRQLSANARLYERAEGASQAEVTEAAAELGSTQKGYYNMLDL